MDSGGQEGQELHKQKARRRMESAEVDKDSREI